MLTLSDIQAGYGSLQILHGVNFTVDKGEIVALLGANGAGKTTTLRVISGLVPARGGSVTFEGQDITGLRSDKRVGMGLVQVAEGRELFGTLTVEENLHMGAWTTSSSQRTAAMSEVLDLFPILSERRKQRTETMSWGQQQMLAVGAHLWLDQSYSCSTNPALG